MTSGETFGAREGGTTIRIFAKPKASRSKVLGIKEGRLEVALAAPPVDGAANDELVATLAKALGVPRSRVEIASGATSRDKLVWVRELGPDEVRARLERA